MVPGFHPVVTQISLYGNFIDVLRAKSHRDHFAPGTNTLMSTLIHNLVHNLVCNGPVHDISAIKRIMEHSLNTDNRDCCDLLLKRILTEASLTPNNLEAILLPMLPGMEALRIQYKISIGSMFGVTYKKIVLSWLDKCFVPLQERVTQILERVQCQANTCQCVFCGDIVPFLLSPGPFPPKIKPRVVDEGKKLTFGGMKPKNRDHVKERLGVFGGDDVARFEEMGRTGGVAVSQSLLSAISARLTEALCDAIADQE